MVRQKGQPVIRHHVKNYLDLLYTKDIAKLAD